MRYVAGAVAPQFKHWPPRPCQVTSEAVQGLGGVFSFAMVFSFGIGEHSLRHGLGDVVYLYKKCSVPPFAIGRAQHSVAVLLD
jgi:hypothetical protein